MEAVNRRPGPESKARVKYRSARVGNASPEVPSYKLPQNGEKRGQKRGLLTHQPDNVSGHKKFSKRVSIFLSLRKTRLSLWKPQGRKPSQVGKRARWGESTIFSREVVGEGLLQAYRAMPSTEVALKRRARRPRPHYDTPEAQRSERRFNRAKEKKKRQCKGLKALTRTEISRGSSSRRRRF